MSTVRASTVPKPERVDLILNQLDQLPTLPAIATRVLQVTTREESSARDVVELIESDQSLSANILGLVSKASFGAGRTVDTVDKAVVLLGFDAIRHAVLSIKVFETFAALDGDVHSHFDRSEFWKHALAVACAGHLITERWPGHIDPEVAFVCGLLHDIGKVALDACLPKSYDRVFRVAQSRHAAIIDVEQELLGVDHTIAGKRLAQRWQLPASLLECIWLHHHTPDVLPDSVSNPDVVQIVNLANVWVHEQRFAPCSAAAPEASSTEIALQMGMPVEHLQDIAPLLLERIRDRAQLLGLDDLTPGRLYASTVASVNTELSRLTADLMRSNRQLQSRSELVDIIHQFNVALHSHSTLLDICQLAASFTRKLLDVPAVAVFSQHPQGQVQYIGLNDADGLVAEVVTVDKTDDKDSAWEAAAQHPGLIVAPPSTETMRQRLGRRLGAAPYWMLPVLKSHEAWGGIVFHADVKQLEHVNASLPDLNIFLSTLAIALANGHERLHAERLNEGMAQVNRQLKAAQAELLRTRSLQMVAEMAAGAAHELNNPLAVISGRGEMTKDAVTDELVKKDLRIIVDQARRCSEIVNELMAFAKPKPPQPARLCLPLLLERLISQWLEKSSLTPEQISVAVSDPDLHIHADADQVQHIFEELLRNAYEACDPQSARLIVNCRADVTDERVVVTVQDNGCGMSREVLEKARDPFFSHKPAGRGRGLGLSRAFRWCELNGGFLRIESQPGEGTQVRVAFQLVQ